MSVVTRSVFAALCTAARGPGVALAVGALALFWSAEVIADGDKPTGIHDSGRDSIRPLIDPAQAMRVSKAAVGGRIGSHRFMGTDRRAVDFSAFRGKPVIVSMVYTSCFHTCPLITENLVRAVEAAESALGRDGFGVVTVGFDTEVDTPDRMRSFGREHGITRADWALLSADAATIKAFTKDIGFVFKPSPRGFDHLAQTTLIDSEGKVYWQIYGEEFAPPMLVEPLMGLVYGRSIDFAQPESLWKRIRLVCTVYDPTEGRYRFSYGIFIGLIIGLLSLGGVGIVLGRWYLDGRDRLQERGS